MGIHINVSDKVAATESRDFDPVPTGKYLVQIDGAEIREVKGEDSPNKGAPMCNIEFTIVEGEYEGRKMFTNIMLFGDAYSAVWLCKALGLYDGKGALDFPEPGDLLGVKLVVKALMVGETVDKKDPTKKYAPKNEVKGFWNESTWNGAASASAVVPATKKSLLP